jgi:SARP family transcriptional regulator, regulator of embCAB operon
MIAETRPSRLQSGCDSADPTVRVYLTGELCVEAGERLARERHLPGPQARHLLAFLIAGHSRAVGQDEIAEELWEGSPPKALASSLKSLVSRTRTALTAAGFDGTALIVGAPGVYRFRLPAGGWIDLDAARAAIHRAETLLASGDFEQAARETFVGRLITARPLLPGRAGPWVQRTRRELVDLRIRSLECSVRAQIARGNPMQATRDAELAVELAPTREPGWRLLMDAHAAAGDIASAIATYGRCRDALGEALGVGPSALTREHHMALLAHAG